MKNLGLPKKVLFCKKCVISNQRPSSTVEFRSKKTEKKNTIFFDQEGVCDACNFNKIKSTINWDKRNKDLEKLLKKFRKSNGEYDVVVPGSGGKDSAYTSHILKYKYGMNPLTVTWSPHLYTDIGWKNFENWSKIGGLDNILFTPNGRLHSYLTQQSFLNLLHPFQPFILGQRIIGPLFASKYNVKLVMYGENQAEYGNKSSENKNPKMNNAFFTIKNNDMITLGGRTIKNIINKTKFKIQDFQPYIPLKIEYILKKKIEVHYLGYYLKWDPQECYYYASENTGFQANEERTEGTYSKYSSIDDKIDMFHYYTTLIKFGIGRATYDAAQEIRNNKITREEGISLVKKYDQEFPEKYFVDFLNYIQINKDIFFKTIDQYRSNHLWIKSNNKWKLKYPIWNEKKF
tara:strand:+ start:115 stop:1323 length:1209 start_codon:yes stop_codon:yes gene_type:complete